MVTPGRCVGEAEFEGEVFRFGDMMFALHEQLAKSDRLEVTF